MAVVVPVSELNPAIVTRVSQAYEYEGGKRTDKRVVNEVGAPISRLTVFGRIMGNFQEYTIEAPDMFVENLESGKIVIPEGENLGAEISGADFGGIRVKIVQVDTVNVLSFDAGAAWDTWVKQYEEYKKAKDSAK